MADYSDQSPDALERRQAARLALLRQGAKRDRTPAAQYVAQLAAEQRQGSAGPLPAHPARTAAMAAVQPLSEDERDLAAGLYFTVAERRQAERDAEHRLRRRRADREVVQRERLYASLRDQYGPDDADRLMRS